MAYSKRPGIGQDITKLGARLTHPGLRAGQDAGGLAADTIYAGRSGAMNTIYAGTSGAMHTIYAGTSGAMHTIYAGTGSALNTVYAGGRMDTVYGGGFQNTVDAFKSGGGAVVSKRIVNPATREPVTIVYNQQTGLYLDSKLGRWLPPPAWVTAQIG